MPRRAVVGVAVAFLVVALAIGGGWAGVLAFQATPDATPETGAAEIIEVPLEDVDGQQVGVATFEQTVDGVTIVVLIQEGMLEPGEHGIHVHEFGVCDPSGDQPFSSAGGHFNPTDAEHGAPEDEGSHAGDLGNILVNPDGSAQFEITTDKFTLGAAPPTLADPDGSALVIHANPDDLTSQPSGESGDRVACGVIFEGTAATPGATPGATPDEGFAVGTPGVGEPAAGFVEVELTEFAIDMPTELPAGAVTFIVTNAGTVEHNFEIEGQGIEEAFETNLQPGETRELGVVLEQGTYEVYCPVGNHAEMGMQLELTVTEFEA